MKKRSLIWTTTLVFLLGPVEPVFAFDRDIAGQFPDVVTSGGGNVWGVESTPAGQNQGGRNSAAQAGGNPWTVEMWSRGRRRLKHFRGANMFNNFNNYVVRRPQQPYTTYQSQDQVGSDFWSQRYNGATTQYADATDAIPLDRKPDKFADAPRVDANGVRRFGNGRHYDLSSMPMDQALAVSQASDGQYNQRDLMERQRQREMERERESQLDRQRDLDRERERANQRFNRFNRF